MSARYTITGGDRFHEQYRPSRQNPRIRIQPMQDAGDRFILRCKLIGWTIAAASAVLFCGGYV